MAKMDELYKQAQPVKTAQTAQPAMTAQQPNLQPVSYIENGQKQMGVANMPKADTAPDYYDQQRAGYQNMYDEAVRHNNEQAERAAEQAREAAEAQRQALAQGYQGTNRQLYRDYMENRRRLPQQMGAAGYSGGLSESAQLRLRNSYEEALAENERSRMGQQATADANLANRLYEIRAAADSGNQEAWQQRQAYEQTLRDQQRQDQISHADTLAAAGDFSGYRALGYTQNEIDAMTRSWLASNPDMKSAWIAAHPEDAERLGIREEYSGYYAPQPTPAEQIQQALQAGASWDDVRRIGNEMVESGELGLKDWNQAERAAYESWLVHLPDLPRHY